MSGGFAGIAAPKRSPYFQNLTAGEQAGQERFRDEAERLLSYMIEGKGIFAPGATPLGGTGRGALASGLAVGKSTYGKYGPVLMKLARKFAGRPADVEDMAQTGYQRILEVARQHPEILDKPASYGAAIARHAMRDAKIQATPGTMNRAALDVERATQKLLTKYGHASDNQIIAELRKGDPKFNADTLARIRGGRGEAIELTEGTLASASPERQAALLREAAAELGPRGKENLAKYLAGEEVDSTAVRNVIKQLQKKLGSEATGTGRLEYKNPRSASPPPISGGSDVIARNLNDIDYVGYQAGFGRVPGQHLYNLKIDLPGHPKGSTVSERTLRELGYKLPHPISGTSSAPDIGPEPTGWLNAPQWRTNPESSQGLNGLINRYLRKWRTSGFEPKNPDPGIVRQLQAKQNIGDTYGRTLRPSDPESARLLRRGGQAYEDVEDTLFNAGHSIGRETDLGSRMPRLQSEPGGVARPIMEIINEMWGGGPRWLAE